MIARYGDTDYGYSEAGYGYGVRSFRGVFDGLAIASSFLGAWSFSRRLWSNVNVPLFRARRATDSAERDWFGTGPQGEVNITEFQSWCSGGDAFAVTLYDQSGLARNFAQATTTIQPILAESGTAITENGRLAAKFVAADARRMSIASSTAMFNALHTTGGTVLAVSRANDTAAGKTIIASRNITGREGFFLFRSATEQVVFNGGRSDVGGVATNGDTFSVTTAVKGTSNLLIVAQIDPDNATASSRALIWVNGGLDPAVNAATGTPFAENSQTVLSLGANDSSGGAYDGTISEVAAFSDLISTADRTTWQSRSGIFYTVAIS